MYHTQTLRFRYAVYVLQNDVKQRLGTILANNYSHAQTKAQQLYNSHCWAERLS